jgi:carnosine N-methyltransferase
VIKSPASLDMAGHTHSHSHNHSQHSHAHDMVQTQDGPAPAKKRRRHKPTDFDMDKLRSTIKQFVRDWSEEVQTLLSFALSVADTALGTERARCLLPAHERRTSRAFL